MDIFSIEEHPHSAHVRADQTCGFAVVHGDNNAPGIAIKRHAPETSVALEMPFAVLAGSNAGGNGVTPKPCGRYANFPGRFGQGLALTHILETKLQPGVVAARAGLRSLDP